MDEVWKRLTQARSTQQREPSSVDKEGARLYLDFQDCLDRHKYHVFFGVGAITIPWSYKKKSLGPFVIGVILSLIPDLLYANWRCDDKYRAFERHCDRVKAAMQQHLAAGAATGAATGAGAAAAAAGTAAAAAAEPRR